MKRRYPERLVVPPFQLEVVYRLGRAFHVGGSPLDDGDPERPWVRRRECTGWLRSGRKRVGGFELNSYEVSPFVTNEWFVEIMDRDCSYESHMARALTDAWEEIDEVTCYGNVLDIRGIWVRQDISKPGLVGAIINTLI